MWSMRLSTIASMRLLACPKIAIYRGRDDRFGHGGRAMASGFEMRVGDAEREAAAAELREHYASGRLTLEELNERLDAAFDAKTRGDLNTVMRDLPSVRPGWSAAGGRASSPAAGRPAGAGEPFGPGGATGPSRAD